MASQQEAIILKVLDLVTNGLPSLPVPVLPPAGLLPPHRSVMRPIEEDQLPTYCVMVAENSEDVSQPGDPPAAGVFRRMLTLYIEVRDIAPPADPDGSPDRYLDKHADFVSTVLLTDDTLGGTADRTEFDRCLYQAFDASQPFIGAALVFRVYYTGFPI